MNTTNSRKRTYIRYSKPHHYSIVDITKKNSDIITIKYRDATKRDIPQTSIEEATKLLEKMNINDTPKPITYVKNEIYDYFYSLANITNIPTEQAYSIYSTLKYKPVSKFDEVKNLSNVLQNLVNNKIPFSITGDIIPIVEKILGNKYEIGDVEIISNILYKIVNNGILFSMEDHPKNSMSEKVKYGMKILKEICVNLCMLNIPLNKQISEYIKNNKINKNNITLLLYEYSYYPQDVILYFIKRRLKHITLISEGYNEYLSTRDIKSKRRYAYDTIPEDTIKYSATTEELERVAKEKRLMEKIERDRLFKEKIDRISNERKERNEDEKKKSILVKFFGTREKKEPKLINTLVELSPPTPEYKNDLSYLINLDRNINPHDIDVLSKRYKKENKEILDDIIVSLDKIQKFKTSQINNIYSQINLHRRIIKNKIDKNAPYSETMYNTLISKKLDKYDISSIKETYNIKDDVYAYNLNIDIYNLIFKDKDITEKDIVFLSTEYKIHVDDILRMIILELELYIFYNGKYKIEGLDRINKEKHTMLQTIKIAKELIYDYPNITNDTILTACVKLSVSVEYFMSKIVNELHYYTYDTIKLDDYELIFSMISDIRKQDGTEIIKIMSNELQNNGNLNITLNKLIFENDENIMDEDIDIITQRLDIDYELVVRYIIMILRKYIPIPRIDDDNYINIINKLRLKIKKIRIDHYTSFTNTYNTFQYISYKDNEEIINIFLFGLGRDITKEDISVMAQRLNIDYELVVKYIIIILRKYIPIQTMIDDDNYINIINELLLKIKKLKKDNYIKFMNTYNTPKYTPHKNIDKDIKKIIYKLLFELERDIIARDINNIAKLLKIQEMDVYGLLISILNKKIKISLIRGVRSLELINKARRDIRNKGKPPRRKNKENYEEGEDEEFYEPKPKLMKRVDKDEIYIKEIKYIIQNGEAITITDIQTLSKKHDRSNEDVIADIIVELNQYTKNNIDPFSKDVIKDINQIIIEKRDFYFKQLKDIVIGYKKISYNQILTISKNTHKNEKTIYLDIFNILSDIIDKNLNYKIMDKITQDDHREILELINKEKLIYTITQLVLHKTKITKNIISTLAKEYNKTEDEIEYNLLAIYNPISEKYTHPTPKNILRKYTNKGSLIAYYPKMITKLVLKNGDITYEKILEISKNNDKSIEVVINDIVGEINNIGGNFDPKMDKNILKEINKERKRLLGSKVIPNKEFTVTPKYQTKHDDLLKAIKNIYLFRIHRLEKIEHVLNNILYILYENKDIYKNTKYFEESLLFISSEFNKYIIILNKHISTVKSSYIEIMKNIPESISISKLAKLFQTRKLEMTPSILMNLLYTNKGDHLNKKQEQILDIVRSIKKEERVTTSYDKRHIAQEDIELLLDVNVKNRFDTDKFTRVLHQLYNKYDILDKKLFIKLCIDHLNKWKIREEKRSLTRINIMLDRFDKNNKIKIDLSDMSGDSLKNTLKIIYAHINSVRKNSKLYKRLNRLYDNIVSDLNIIKLIQRKIDILTNYNETYKFKTRKEREEEDRQHEITLSQLTQSEISKKDLSTTITPSRIFNYDSESESEYHSKSDSDEYLSEIDSEEDSKSNSNDSNDYTYK